jgi:uncharacterized membrane protein
MKLVLRIVVAFMLIAIAAGLYGCGGGGAKVQTESSVTLGQELMDLDKAYEKGLISEKDYNKTRKELIKKKNK